MFPSIKVEKGIYQIKILINKTITDCKFLFLGCSSIISIDLSSFDTQKVTNMLGMFSKKIKKYKFYQF